MNAFLLLVSVLFADPLPSFNRLGGKKLKWRQLAHHQLMSQQSSPHSKAKANYKRPNLRKIGNSGISDVAIVSVHSEKTRLKKMITIIIIISMNKSQESTGARN